MSATPAALVRDEPAWIYLAQPGALATRRLRVWRTADGHLVAVVTETPHDTGTSITNAAETICAQLRAEHPGAQLRVVEHYTRPDTAAVGDTWALDTVDESGGWRVPLTAADTTGDSVAEIIIDHHGHATWHDIDLTALGVHLD